tara:strand:- start:1169 stop:1576 length:408 start_codon:yes stop_codon:yes gene_type:complete
LYKYGTIKQNLKITKKGLKMNIENLIIGENIGGEEWVVNASVPVNNVLTLLRKTKRATFFLKTNAFLKINDSDSGFNNTNNVKVRWKDVVTSVEDAIRFQELKRGDDCSSPLKDGEELTMHIMISEWDKGCVFLG